MRHLVLLLPIAFAVLACGEDENPPPPKKSAQTGGSSGSGGSGTGGGSATGGSTQGGRGGTSGAGTGGNTGGTGGASGSGGSSGASGSGGKGQDLEPCPPGEVCECDDGMDNDGDGLVDWHFDLGCTARNDSSEGGVPTGDLEGGWTVFEPADDTRVVYVSAEGNDSSDGLTPETAKRTIESGIESLRDNSADWLLLRRGDSFMGLPLNVTPSGRSATAPIVISSYGTEITQPIVEQDETTYRGSNLAIAHLHLRNTGISAAGTAGNVLFEGTWFQASGFSSSESLEGIRTNISLRRNVFTDASTQIYAGNIHGFLVEENVIYDPATNNMGGHAMYINYDGNEDVVTRGNLVHYGSNGDGIMMRPGGLSENNVVAGIQQSAIHFETWPEPTPGMASAHNNLIVERKGPDSNGIAYHENWVGELTDNIVADEPDNIDAPPYRAGASIMQSNNVNLTEPVDSSRPELKILGIYSADVLGGDATTTAFFEAAVQQRKFVFRQELTGVNIIAYVRENFVQ